MEENQVLARALKTLEQFVLELSEQAGCGEDYGRKVWEGIRSNSGALRKISQYPNWYRGQIKDLVSQDVRVRVPPGVQY